MSTVGWALRRYGWRSEAGSHSANLPPLQSPCLRVLCGEGLHAVSQTEVIPPAAGERPGPDDPESPFLAGVSTIL